MRVTSNENERSVAVFAADVDRDLRNQGKVSLAVGAQIYAVEREERREKRKEKREKRKEKREKRKEKREKRKEKREKREERRGTRREKRIKTER